MKLEAYKRVCECKHVAIISIMFSLKFFNLLRPVNRNLLCQKFATNNLLKISSNGFSKRVSGYESETAEIQDSLKSFTIGQDFFEDTEAFDGQAAKSEDRINLPVRSVKRKSLYQRDTEFVDFRKVTVKGGNGGNGMICFLQLWANAKAGPSGGDGGNGGHVILESCRNTRSLNRINSSYAAPDGEKGMHKDMTGKNAEHLPIKVPIGTIVKEAGTEKILAFMNQDGMKFLAARGGAGGKGNHYFLNNKNRHPRVAEFGASGEQRTLLLELKIIAQAGLVGFPNVGKSTLLSAISRAKPKIAAYPFTTLKPSIGIVQYDDDEQLAVADLPGIIEGAHKNRGLGFSFLKHVERCVCLFYVIDISATDPYQQFTILRKELEHYKKDLSQRPLAIVVNKMDTEDSEEKFHQLKLHLEEDNLNHLRLFPVSAKYGSNLTELLIYFRQLYNECDKTVRLE